MPRDRRHLRRFVTTAGQKYGLALFCVLAGVVVMYLPALSGDFVYDDQAFIVDNAHVRRLDQWPTFWTDRTTLSRTGHGIWRPLRTLSFAIDYRVWGLRTRGYHLTSVLAHVINVCLIWWLSLWLWWHTRWEAEAHGLALVCAAVWAAHPVQTETVAWISSRGDLLAGVGGLGALILLLTPSRRPGPQHARYWFAWVLWIMALWCKESAVVVPLVWIWLEGCVWKQWPRVRAWRRYAIWVGWGVIYWVMRYAVLGQFGQREFWGGSLATSLLTVGALLPTYLRLMSWPTGLHLFYHTPIVSQLTDPRAWIGLGCLAAFGAAWWRWRGKAVWSAMLGWWCLHMLPVAQIAPLSGGMLSEHYLYLALWAWTILMIGGLRWMGDFIGARMRWPQTHVFRCALVVLFTALVCGTVKRNGEWRSSQSLWAAEAVHSAWHPKTQVGLGNVHHRAGEWAKALTHYQEAAVLDPDDPDPHANMADVFQQQGEFARAEAAARRGVALGPENPYAYRNLARILLGQGRLDEAAIAASEATRWYDDSDELWAFRGSVEDVAGRLVEAEAAYRKALALNPRSAEVLNQLGIVLDKTGRSQQAREAWTQALRLNPALKAAQRNLDYQQQRLDSTP